jgi:hypothetical protein
MWCGVGKSKQAVYAPKGLLNLASLSRMSNGRRAIRPKVASGGGWGWNDGLVLGLGEFEVASGSNGLSGWEGN